MSDPRDRSNLAVDCLIHDLNNVFQTVIDAAELIASDPKWAAAAATIVRGVERGRRIVASLAEADRPVCVRALVESAAVFAKDFAAAIGGPELRFAIDVEADVILTVRRSAVERALMNLFINSAQAAHAAGARTCSISVSAVRDGGSVALTISDDGPGIPEGILSSIFCPHVSTRRGSPGLGLHIVESAVIESGGSVQARNGDAGGAVFSIRLPAGADSAARSEVAVSH
ncbi:MAG TPA: HAMP domain-containing sensor histidine kinase [Bryobacteraceae bacterium]|nr:HAMP domain-containing sensor histidine kinase [Bryobacteraceae bacterium]